MVKASVIANPQADGAGYRHYRIPGMVFSHRGTLFVYYEARREWSDVAKCDIVVLRSENGGESFSRCFFADSDDYFREGDLPNRTLDNPVMIVGENGVLHLLYSYNVGYDGLYYSFSLDDGITWSEPRDIRPELLGNEKGQGKDDPLGMVAFGPTHGICLSRGAHRGRLIVPVWTANLAFKGVVGDVYTVYSDDGGKHWCWGDRVAQNRDESSIAELSDGRVMINSRMYTFPYGEATPNRTPEEAYRGVSVSESGIDGWSDTVYDHTLIDPACEGTLASAWMENGEHLLLFCNCASKEKRWDLTVRGSKDDGKTWSSSLDLGHVGWYSEVAIDPKGTVYVVHENPTVNENRDMALELFRFPVEDLK